MPTGPKVFFAMPNVCGFRPCDRTHLKNGLVPDLFVSVTYEKYPGVTGSVLSYRPFYFLSASRMLAEPVSVVILVYSTR